ncbi:MAG: glycosyl transferase [Legionellales bacterium]|nr:glycosyl transferase [Legionellales bacterium]|tara:strand:- start:75550 stop:76875 length:1326 start_codon:yes stop_codon:yes gene_type:complete
MTERLIEIYQLYLITLKEGLSISYLRALFPFVIFIEMPFYIIVVISILRTYIDEIFSVQNKLEYCPNVTCLVCGYSEGKDITITLKSLTEQLYPGNIEILILIDDAINNASTYKAAKHFIDTYKIPHNRKLILIPKRTRGGHSSSLNLGLKLAKGDILVSLDGDCGCDNDLVLSAVRGFKDGNIVGSSGTLRVRNAKTSLVTRLQAIEYMLGIPLTRVGLSTLNIVNNISGALGIYRTNFLRKIGGWKSGTAEDLDLTLRMKSYFKRHPNLRIIHNPKVVAHTDAPDTWRSFIKQRLRWDGDIIYIFCYRHWRVLRPKYLGWVGFLAAIWNILLLHVVLPFIITFGFIVLFVKYPMHTACVALLLSYTYYLFITVFLYTIYWLLISERKLYDMSFMPLIVIFPFFTVFSRILSAFAIVCELVLRTHRDTSMNPWWVNRKNH